MTGKDLALIASSLATASALVRTLREASGLSLLPDLFESIPVQAELRLRINEAVDDAGEVHVHAHVHVHVHVTYMCMCM